jgi:hypothetical protein
MPECEAAPHCQQPGNFLTRHVSGDWGEVPPEDIKENELSLQARLSALERLSH